MAEDKKKEINVTVIEVTEEYLKEKLYKIRGKRVLLDADLAEIYGYDTKGFNRQVKNNIEKFDEDFMFELTDEELEDLRYKNCTANISSKSRYNPHVFTEQGLYMLMEIAAESGREIEIEDAIKYPSVLLYGEIDAAEYLADRTLSEAPPKPESFLGKGIQFTMGIDWEHIDRNKIYIIYYTDAEKFDGFTLLPYRDWYVAY